MTEAVLLQFLPFAALGALLGFAYLYALGLNVRLYVRDGPGWIAVLVHLVRIPLIGVGFAMCAHLGALPLLSSLIGFQVMRTVAINQQLRAMERKS